MSPDGRFAAETERHEEGTERTWFNMHKNLRANAMLVVICCNLEDGRAY